MLGPLIAVRRYRIGRVTNRFAVCWTPRHRSHVNTLRRKRFPLGPLVYSAFKPCFGSIARMLWGDHPGCSRVTDSAEPPPHFIHTFVKPCFSNVLCQ